MLTLYHGRTSVCSIKARLALAEKGVSFDSRVMTQRGRPGVLAWPCWRLARPGYAR